jgi:hypothetical protein
VRLLPDALDTGWLELPPTDPVEAGFPELLHPAVMARIVAATAKSALLDLNTCRFPFFLYVGRFLVV